MFVNSVFWKHPMILHVRVLPLVSAPSVPTLTEQIISEVNLGFCILKNGSSAWNHSCTYGKNCIKINLKDFYVMLLKLYELFWEEIDKFPVKGSTSSKYHWVYQESWKWKKRERCHSVSKLYQELWIQSKERKYWHRLDKFINISMHHVQEGSTCKHSKNWWSKKQPFQSSYCPHLK